MSPVQIRARRRRAAAPARAGGRRARAGRVAAGRRRAAGAPPARARRRHPGLHRPAAAAQLRNRTPRRTFQIYQQVPVVYFTV